MIKCLSTDSWCDAALGRSNYIALARWVPRGFHFKVYLGKRSCPSLVDARTVFVCLGCKRVGFRKWIAKVMVKNPKLYNDR